jgi:hypothetical protein
MRIGDIVCLSRIIIVTLILAEIWTCAHARDNGQWENVDPEVRNWYSSLRQPDQPSVSCCGNADAYWCDDYYARDGMAYCKITDDRADAELGRPHIEIGTEIQIPERKLKWGEHDPQRGDRVPRNPTGHSVVFMGYAQTVYCFVQGGGA